MLAVLTALITRSLDEGRILQIPDMFPRKVAGRNEIVRAIRKYA
jgi:hypothetical protein